MESLKKFIKKRRPHVIAVAAEGREAIQVADDIKFSINELEQEHQMATISVELVDGEVARVFQGSTRAEVCCMLCTTCTGFRKHWTGSHKLEL